MEATLLRLNKHWSGAQYRSLCSRSLFPNLQTKKHLPQIQVLTGIRRSGKSTLFHLLINDLLVDGVDPKSILLLNMDEPMFTSIWDNAAGLYKVVELAEKLTAVRVKYLFLDEIQQIKGWELFAKGAYDSKRFEKIYVTGSNSNLLQNQFATLLSGRYFANRVHPFSLSELLRINNFTDRLSVVERKPELLSLVDRYLEWGGFPEIALGSMDADTRMELLNSYYESIVLKDCIAYNKVREPDLFRRLLFFVLSNVAAPMYYSGVGKAVNSNENTARTYLSYAEQAYVLSDVTNFSFSLKEGARPQHKFYSTDNGLMNAVGFRFSPRNGAMLENAVHNELLNNGYDMLSFVKQVKECDFVARKNGQYHAFQVCYELNPQNKERELAGFKALPRELDVAFKTIVTYDQQGREDDVLITPFWELFGNVE